MSDTIVTGIRLSSGTTVNIPIFPYNTDRETIVRMGGVMMVREWNKIAWRSLGPLTDSELFELASMMTGRVLNHYAYEGNTPPTIPVDPEYANYTHYYLSFLMYYNENGQGGYTFNCCIYGNPNPSTTTYIATGQDVWYGVYDPLSDIDDVFLEWFYNGGSEHYINNFDAACTYFADHVSTHDARWIKFANIKTDSITANYMNNFSLVMSGGHIDTNPDYLIDRLEAYTELVPDNGIMLIETDPDNPYTYEASTVGGGNGAWGTFDPNSVDPAEIPALPTISAANAGFISIYNPSTSQLRALSAYLWSSAFDIDSFKKLFSDPMQCIIGLSVVPVTPSLSGAKNVMFGDIDTGVSMTAIASEYVEKDMGSVNLELLYGSFMDYGGHTSIQIYLPYIGFRQLSPDDIIGGSIHVVYHINVLDGGCTAYIEHSSRGVLYQYSGSCIANVPLSSINYSGALQNAISAAINGSAVAAGIITGAAPVSLMGAAGLASNAANLAMNSKPTVQRSGSVSGSSGLMGIQRPYVIIERPNISVPANMNNFIGNTTNVTMTLGSCHGFTMVDHIHLDNVICTEGERDELLRLLKEGVIL